MNEEIGHSLWVHMLHPPEDCEVRSYLRAKLDPRIRLTEGAVSPIPSGTEILIAGRPSREQLGAATSLRTVIIPYAGIPAETRDLLMEYPHVRVHNLHHNAETAAELAVALLLAVAKGLIPADHALRRNDWQIRYQGVGTLLLDGKTALILGFGAVGQRIARTLKTFGMNILVTRRHAERSVPERVEVHPPGELPALLHRADVLVVALPLTQETEGLIGEAELARLPQGALFVNIARGAIVDEAALYNALKSGSLGGAGIDVWYRYPKDIASRSNTPPSEYPVHELDNVVMSPHRSGHVAGTEQRRMEHLCRALNAAAKGEAIPHRVDVERGY